MRVAVHFASHPDDEMLGPPATLMALRDSGYRVVNVSCGLGRTEQEARRRGELREACRIAGFELRVPEPAIAMSSDDDIASARARLLHVIGEEVDGLEPQIVLSPSPHDRHRAHELVGRAVRDVLVGRADGPRWWMWGLWASLPFPTIGTTFDRERREEILEALSSYRGELERNDYRRLLVSRAEMNAVLGPELLFGFGTAAPAGCTHLELLTEVGIADGRWRFGRPRWFDPSEPQAELSDVGAGGWLGASSAAELVGRNA